MSSLPTATFLVGVEIGLAVAVPIGPMGLLCIQRTLSFGLVAGLMTGLAAATVQVAYSTIAVAGLGATVVAWVGAGAKIFSVVSALLLFWFAFRLYKRRLVISARPAHRPAHLVGFYGGGLAVGLTNPMTIVLFLAAVPALATADDMAGMPALVSGVFSGACSWYLALSTAIALLRERLSMRVLEITNATAGLTLALIGFLMIVSALEFNLFWAWY
jgi:threonine/homoserine/homoserine lactone efflux protein